MKPHPRAVAPGGKGANRGLTLVELMLAMVLGLLVIAGVGSVYLANQQIYATSQNLSQYQENIRYIFEILTRDIRQTDGTPCRKRQTYRYEPQSTIVKATGYGGGVVEWGFGIEGYTGSTASVDRSFGTGTAARVAGTDAIRTTGGSGKVYSVTQHNADDKIITLNGSPSGAMFIICNLNSAASFSGTVNGSTITYSADLNGTYGIESRVTGYSQAFWYVGCNGLAACDTAEGRSLYRGQNNLAASGGDSPNPIINGVRDLQLEYLARGAASYTATVASWNDVIAVRVTLDLFPPEAENLPDSAPAAMTPRLTHVIALRNRLQPQ